MVANAKGARPLFGVTSENWTTLQETQLNQTGGIAALIVELNRRFAEQDWPAPETTNAIEWLREIENAFSNSQSWAWLAGVAYSGKVEDSVRDLVVSQLDLHAGLPCGDVRHWYGKEYKEVDAVKGIGGRAVAAFQAKQIFVGDLYNKKGKALNVPHQLLQALNLDIRVKAPWKLNSKSSDVQVGLLLVADFGSQSLTLNSSAKKYEHLITRQSRPREPQDWRLVLDGQLGKLALSVARDGDHEMKGSWQGSTNGCQITIHWFIVIPAVQ